MVKVLESVLSRALQKLNHQLDRCGDRLCRVKSWYRKDFALEYSDPLIRSVYILRYFPAYLAEYYIACRRILKTGLIGEPVRMASFGCGCAPDAIAMLLACREEQKNFHYIGIDSVRWPRCFELPEITYKWTDFSSVDPAILRDRNVLFFPKSLVECAPQGLDGLIWTLSATQPIPHRIALVNSTPSPVTPAWNRVLDCFRSKGYHVDRTIDLDDLDGRSFNRIIHEEGGLTWRYPDEIMEQVRCLGEACPGVETCGNKCFDVLNRSPIMMYKMTHMRDEIVFLSRERRR